MKIACLGGGPAGLYFAISMKLRDRAHDVTVFERNRPDDTFGWGVVFSDETFDNIAANDPPSAETIREAVALGVDTLIVGEGPHWTAVDAPEHGLVIVYAGHYATETLGIMALAENVAARFEVPWSFIAAPTGL